MKIIYALVLIPMVSMGASDKETKTTKDSARSFDYNFWRSYGTTVSKEYKRTHPESTLTGDALLEELQSQARQEATSLFNAFNNDEPATIHNKFNETLIRRYLEATREPVESNPNAAIGQKIEILNKVATNLIQTKPLVKRPKATPLPKPGPRPSPTRAG